MPSILPRTTQFVVVASICISLARLTIEVLKITSINLSIPELFSFALPPTTAVEDNSFLISVTMPFTLSFSSILLKYLSILDGSVITIFKSFLLKIDCSLSCADISKGFLKAT